MPLWRRLFVSVPFTLATAAMATLATQPPSDPITSAPAEGVPSWKDSLRKQTNDLCDSLKSFTHKHFAELPPMERLLGVYALKPDCSGQRMADWTRVDSGTDLPERCVLLVHGLDDTGDVWEDLTPAIRQRPELDGLGVVRLEYPNDQAIGASAGMLHDALGTMFASGARRVDLVCHSMGGLLARDVLTRAEFYDDQPTGHAHDQRPTPDLHRIILLGTPNQGSPFARLRAIAEAREVLWRWLDSENHNVRDLGRFDLDGDGQAGKDLLPNSDYLNDLNARPLPTADRIPITSIIARVITPDDLRVETAVNLPVVRTIFGEAEAASLRESCAQLTRGLGDGVVSTRSAWLDGAQETIYVEASHRGMVRRMRIPGTDLALGTSTADASKVPPAIPYVIERLMP